MPSEATNFSSGAYTGLLLRTRFAMTATRMLRNRTWPTSSSSLMKFAVACTSIDDGATGIKIDCVRARRSCSSNRPGPAGASMMSCCVSRGISRRPFAKPEPRRVARSAPWILRASLLRCCSQFRLEPWGSKSAIVVVMSRDAK